VQRFSSRGSFHDACNAAVLDPLGNAYVTGLAGSDAGSDIVTIKYSPSGERLWAMYYDGPGHGLDAAVAAAVDGAGNVYVTGRSEGYISGSDFVAIKYDPGGRQVWVYRYNGPIYAHDEALAIAVDGLDHVYLTGYSEGYLTSGDYLTVKLRQR
jgi:hypothetical protein